MPAKINRNWADAKILVVDDEASNVLLLERILKHAGYTHVKSTRDPSDVLPIVQSATPDIILLDLNMPHLDGHAVLAQLREATGRETFLPVLVLTADVTMQAKERALSEGAMDFLTKPFEPLEVLLRIRNLLRMRLLHLELRGQNTQLEERVVERTKDVEQAAYEIVSRLARAAELRDDDTGQHTIRVGEMSARLGQKLGLANDQVELLGRAAPLHDVGKIGVSDMILLKPAKLTDEEYNIMKGHVDFGGDILSGSRFPLLQMAEEIARYHHERWNGTGYQAGRAGESIPITARIVSVIDVFDALTHVRPYKPAWPVEKALLEIESLSGSSFDPQVVAAFRELTAEDGLLGNLSTQYPVKQF